jgi:hypothetical protein
MTRDIIGRFTALACAALVMAASALFLDEQTELDSARAQAQPTIVASSTLQLPPPVPGLDYTPLDPGQATVPETAATTGTPVAEPAAPTAGDSVTASLGGSDIAVSSVGGSYERDAPNKRRGDKERRR